VRRLIINADDFGLTSGVNRAIAEAHLAGRLTSATLMAGAAASSEAIDFSLNTPSIGVGCHVVLLDGIPSLPTKKIRGITDAHKAAFHPSLGKFLSRLLTGRIPAAEIEAEAAAQIAMLHSRGLRLTHIDTHKHTHMFPAVLRPVLRAARAAGINAVRNPFEPAWATRATPNAPLARRLQVALLRHLQPDFLRIVAEEGFATTDGAIGVLATGTLDALTIASLLNHMPEGTFELVTHPGYDGPDLSRTRTRLTASRRIELDALLSASLKSDVQLTTFAALASHGTRRR
jgi:predicted glycoside hydrolase/deacetylase ChbG (UPF0249 family)